MNRMQQLRKFQNDHLAEQFAAQTGKLIEQANRERGIALTQAVVCTNPGR
jgi:hypothetical protein